MASAVRHNAPQLAMSGFEKVLRVMQVVEACHVSSANGGWVEIDQPCQPF
jgi:hypothetical protein